MAEIAALGNFFLRDDRAELLRFFQRTYAKDKNATQVTVITKRPRRHDFT